MCGICGKILFDSSHSIDSNELSLMMDSLVHRGPDDGGKYVKGNIGLGFRRLSIIDMDTGNQPISNEDETIWIVFNGEIYNHIELRQSLIKKGHDFKTKSDTEVIVHLYEEYGSELVNHLRGMFAFVIWDEIKRKLFCARDRFGIKPFFFYHDKNMFVFGSEIRAIKNAKGVDKKIDILALDSYFAYGYTMGSRTIFENIKKLEPGHTLSIDLANDSRPIIERYWRVNFEFDYDKSQEEWQEELEFTLSESVRIRLMSEVPLGAFLSGGIDSSSVVALMSENTTSRVKTFSMGFRETEFNELHFAREVAEKYNTEHHEKIIEPESIDLLSDIVNIYDEPFADSSAIPTFLVSKFAKEFVTVALSGDGGDELFAGYTRYQNVKNLMKFKTSSKKLHRLLWSKVGNIMPEGMLGEGFAFRLSKPSNQIPAYISLYFNENQRENLYKRDIYDVLRKDMAEKHKLSLIQKSNTSDIVTSLQELDIQTYLVDDILTKVDRASMSNSLEVRVPFLDHKLAELSFRMPVDMKLHKKSSKHILKETMRKYLPRTTLEHRKQGFGVPLDSWFKSDLKDYATSRLLSSNSKLYDYVELEYVRKVMDNHFLGMRDFSAKIWSLLFLDEWLLQNG